MVQACKTCQKSKPVGSLFSATCQPLQFGILSSGVILEKSAVHHQSVGHLLTAIQVTVFPVRIAALLGAQIELVTNARSKSIPSLASGQYWVFIPV